MVSPVLVSQLSSIPILSLWFQNWKKPLDLHPYKNDMIDIEIDIDLIFIELINLMLIVNMKTY